MRVTPWTEWLDRHIPYYEAERLRSQYQHRPPQVVLELSVVDRHQHNYLKKPATDVWLAANAQFKQYQTEPIFLLSDSHQKWFWAFWDEQEAVVCMLKL